MAQLPSSVESLFTAAGWRRSARPDTESLPGASAQTRAAAIIEEYGGLRVGSIGPGRDLGASDVRFYASARPDVATAVEAWSSLGEMAAIAAAHNDHMLIFVSGAGDFYAFTEPDGKLYLIGHSFAEAVERVLLGINYGPSIQATPNTSLERTREG